MFLIFFLKMSSDLGILLSAAGFIAVTTGGHFIYMMLAALWLAVLFAFSALLREKGWLRFLPMAGAALCFLFPDMALTDYLVIGAACLYVLWLCYAGTFMPTWDTQKEIFSIYWKVLAGVFVFEALLDFSSAAASTLPAGVMALACCILLNRALRHEESVYRTMRYQLVNLAGLAAVAFAALLLGSPAVLGAVGAALGWIYDNLISPVLMALLYVFIQLIKGISWLFSWIHIEKVEETEVTNLESGDAASTDWMEFEEGGGVDIRILYAFLIILAGVLLFLLLRKLAGSLRKKASVIQKVNERRLAVTQHEPEDPPAHGAVRKIRELYRKFLRLCRKNSVELKRSDTSSDIEKKSRSLFPEEESEAFREIYIRARYRGEADQKDAEEAADLLSGMKKRMKKPLP